MITKEKIIIRFNKLFRNLFFHLIFWALAFAFYVFLTGENQIFSIYSNILGISSYYVTIALLSISISFVFSFLDILFSDRLMRFLPMRLMMLIKSMFYFALTLAVILAITKPSLEIFATKDYKQLLNEIPTKDIHVWRFVVYFFLSCFLNSFYKGMVKKIGKGNFRNWVFGVLNKPREEERIFMFIDLKASTTIAEQLQHRKFSHLVQDVFNDMAVVDNYYGDIYQYLGDGAIISWNLRQGLRNNNFLKAFYAFLNVLEKRKRYYQRKYGLTPQFKAGIHVGKVMVLQVGQIRRDISYNGDTLNTAARIESQCNEFKQNLLISGDLYDILEDPKQYNFKNVGNIQLKGKKKKVDIYAVKQKAKTKKTPQTRKTVPKTKKG